MEDLGSWLAGSASSHTGSPSPRFYPTGQLHIKPSNPPKPEENNDHYKDSAGAPKPKQLEASLQPALHSPVSCPVSLDQQGLDSAPPGGLALGSLTQGSPWHRQILGTVSLVTSRGCPVPSATD